VVCMAFLLPVGSLAQVAQQDGNQDQRILRLPLKATALDGMAGPRALRA
jgi:hypothetical protein